MGLQCSNSRRGFWASAAIATSAKRGWQPCAMAESAICPASRAARASSGKMPHAQEASNPSSQRPSRSARSLRRVDGSDAVSLMIPYAIINIACHVYFTRARGIFDLLMAFFLILQVFGAIAWPAHASSAKRPPASLAARRWATRHWPASPAIPGTPPKRRAAPAPVRSPAWRRA